MHKIEYIVFFSLFSCDLAQFLMSFTSKIINKFTLNVLYNKGYRYIF